MGYRLMVVVAAVLTLMCGCAAFDNSAGDPYEGFAVTDRPDGDGNTGGLFTGYYTGDMVVESNTCAAVSDEVKLALDVVQSGEVIDVIFEDGSSAKGALTDAKTTVVSKSMNVEYVYYLTFEDGKINGQSEVIEADANGQYAAPCATYSFELVKGEKPAEDLGDPVPPVVK